MIKDFTKSKIYKDIIKNKIMCYFVSPHFDDAIFSAGYLICQLKKNGVPVSVLNVFTKPSDRPYTLSVKKFLNSCGYKDAESLYADRETEDKEVIRLTGAKIVNLGFTDALWRRKKIPKLLSPISKFIPEVEYIYPIFSINMKIGKVSKFDYNLKLDIAKKLKGTIKNKSVIFCPIATGNHMDHTITRDVCNDNFKNIVYWQDYPYSERNTSNKSFVKNNNLNEYTNSIDCEVKSNLINGYKSQIKAIFGSDKINIKTNEQYFN